MKQFQYTKPSGGAYGPHSSREAQQLMVLAAGQQWIHDSDVGATFTDFDGDVWERLPDVVEGETHDATSEPKRDERLERIATAVLAGLLSGSKGWTEPNGAAKEAIFHASNLIAELDKQS